MVKEAFYFFYASTYLDSISWDETCGKQAVLYSWDDHTFEHRILEKESFFVLFRCTLECCIIIKEIIFMINNNGFLLFICR